MKASGETFKIVQVPERPAALLSPVCPVTFAVGLERARATCRRLAVQDLGLRFVALDTAGKERVSVVARCDA